MIDADLILAKEHHGKKRPREDVEQYIAHHINMTNRHIRAMNYSEMFRSAFEPAALLPYTKPPALQRFIDHWETWSTLDDDDLEDDEEE